MCSDRRSDAQLVEPAVARRTIGAPAHEGGGLTQPAASVKISDPDLTDELGWHAPPGWNRVMLPARRNWRLEGTSPVEQREYGRGESGRKWAAHAEVVDR